MQTKDGIIYTGNVELSHNMISNYGKKIPFTQEMSGTAEIITNDVRFLQRLFNPIRAIFKENTDIK